MPYAAVITTTIVIAASFTGVTTGATGGAISTDGAGIVDEIPRHHGAAADDPPSCTDSIAA